MNLRDVNHTGLTTEEHVIIQNDHSFERVDVAVVIRRGPPIGCWGFVNFFNVTHFRLCRKPYSAVSLIQSAGLIQSTLEHFPKILSILTFQYRELV